MSYPITPVDQRPYETSFPYQDERIFPVVPFLTGLAVAPFFYSAFQPGGYYPYPPPPPYYPYGYGPGPGYGYGPKPYYKKGYY